MKFATTFSGTWLPGPLTFPYIAAKSYLVYVTYTTAAQKPSQGRSPRNEVDTTGNP